MHRRIVAALAAIALSLILAAPAFAGYEGQPGNQSNGGGSNGNQGYEGQPGNQSNGG
jgi:hypothetical protein